MIEVEDVRFSYDGERPALDGLTTRIADGEFVCVLGGNGSGKSTLARHLDALLVPDAGRVTAFGLDTSDPELTYAVRSQVGMVFQNPEDQVVTSVVEDDVAFGPENLGVEQPELGERVEAALREVGLSGFARRETSALSGGQRQRVAIAGVLAMRPRALVLDEASAMLDPRGRRGLMRVCHELNDAGMAIVMVTHHMDEAAEADRIVVLDRGRVALEGTPDEVFARMEELNHLNLEVPTAVWLALALRRRGVGVTPHARPKALADELAGMLPHVAKLPERTGAPHAESAGARSEADAVLRFEHVSYSYLTPRERRRAAEGDAWALRDVTFDVRRGELLGIAGHTGSGKSTLVQHMNGLEHPSEGRVLLNGGDLSERHAAAAAKATVGVVMQYPERQLFAKTVRQDVAFGPRNLGVSGDELAGRVDDAIRRVGLDPEAIGELSPFALSGGQQRRVALAGVLAMGPEVLVLDEPAAGLDPRSHRELLRLVRKLHAQGLTIVMVSHDMDDLAALCDRVVVMDGGRVALEGTPAEVFAHADELRAIGLGVPAAEALARELRARGVALAGPVPYDVERLADDLAALALANAGDAPAQEGGPR